MIEIDNFKEVLTVLGFEETSKDKMTKVFGSFNCAISVDFKNEKILYPTNAGLKVNDATTSNFSKPENFVVLECVNRLLEQGYRPEHIELEKRWNLGHDSKGGKADICVYNTDGQSVLFIVECKTYGKEYKGELKNTKTDGGQVFSYWQQERSAKWLCIYASDFIDGKIQYNNEVISCSDDANLIALSKKDDSIKLYINADTVPEKFQVWTETYMQQTWQGLIFGDDTVAYKIGIRPLRKKDLKDFSEDDKIVNRFEEILRHNNVSDKENAFNRLVALFICKLVDEYTKSDSDEVEFQYKQGTDTYESLQDRLQRLHHEGMKDFMGEEIFYVSADYPEQLFENYTGQKRAKAIEDLKRTIRILKYYSNNDFAFKDVHNEELFFQNGKILVEVVQLFQRYRIVYSSRKQFLGNLFETLLSNGFRQDEGQFFTPMPITRFIWDCLPVSKVITGSRGNIHPKVIDYACGAGHFLTEAVEAINYNFNTAQEEQSNQWTRDCIFGIEKDYRLARVAKISLFMNGAGDGNIIFGDGLDNCKERGIANSTFDILVANPPYSVAGFKSHLKLKNNSLSLLNRISENSSEIETLFVERIAQLLKPEGVAAVILPSTILTNDTSYTGAREVLLQNFHIRGIVQLGDKTFGATPTSTVVLFLEKYNSPPQKYDLIQDSVDAIFNQRDLSDWEDSSILQAYLQEIDLSCEDYYGLITGQCFSMEGEHPEYVEQYITAFKNSTEHKNRIKTGIYKKLSDENKVKDDKSRFTSFVQTIEREKLIYFGLVFGEKTTIITSPVENKAKQNFLGFKWTKRDKSLMLETVRPGGLLYDPDNRDDAYCLASAIRSGYLNTDWEGTEENVSYVKRVGTESMIDFSRVRFIKDIRTTAEIKVTFTSRYPLVPLDKLVETIGGLWTGKNGPFVKARVIRGTNFTNDGRFNKADIIEINVEKSAFEKRELKKGDIIIEKSGGSAKQAVGRVILFDLNEKNYSFSNFTNRLRITSDTILPHYLHIVLNRIYIEGYTFGYQTGASNLKNLKIEKYLGIKIPVPEKEVQKEFCKKIAKIDAEYEKSRMSISQYKELIAKAFEDSNIANMGGGYDKGRQ